GVDTDRFNGDMTALMGLTNGGGGGTPVCGDGTCNGGETSDSCPADCRPCGVIDDVYEIDDGDECFAAGGPAQYLRNVADAGEMGDLIWTHTTDNAQEANNATWSLNFTAAGK